MTEPLYDRLMSIKPDGLSANAWAMRAGVSRQVFADIRKRGNATHVTLQKLLASIGRTLSDFEPAARDFDQPIDPAKVPFNALRGADRPRDVPIVGTAECAELEFEGGDAHVMTTAMIMSTNDVIDFARRPATLDGRTDVYAIYFAGESMAPRYETGELAYVDPRRPPSVRDYVIVQLKRDGGGQDAGFVVLAKRLHRRSASWVELEQFNPPAVFRVPSDEIAHVHRIIPWDELVVF